MYNAEQTLLTHLGISSNKWQAYHVAAVQKPVFDISSPVFYFDMNEKVSVRCFLGQQHTQLLEIRSKKKNIDIRHKSLHALCSTELTESRLCYMRPPYVVLDL